MDTTVKVKKRKPKVRIKTPPKCELIIEDSSKKRHNMQTCSIFGSPTSRKLLKLYSSDEMGLTLSSNLHKTDKDNNVS